MRRRGQFRQLRPKKINSCVQVTLPEQKNRPVGISLIFILNICFSLKSTLMSPKILFFKQEIRSKSLNPSGFGQKHRVGRET